MGIQYSDILAAAPKSNEFFEGFDEKFVDVPRGKVFCRIKGEGIPILLLHGYPQTSAMWHRVAPSLAKNYTVICADLTGYGRSPKPLTDADHLAYSKREMAKDLVAMMDALGHDKFYIGAHDRGGRVAHRLAGDHSDRVLALATLDIAPTREMYRDGDSSFAQSYWHWYWLTQTAPFPETLIASDPDFYWLKKCCSGSAGASPFYWQALNEYLTHFRDPAVIHGSCEDYRAAVTIDIEHDNQDERKLTMPLHALWGKTGAIEKHFDCIALWKERAEIVSGHSVQGGHYLAEELPDTVIEEFLNFFGTHSIG
ncbi:MAG: alpha/beta hydrolase [Rhizobiales bacterium]|nr:alpha/beta hydrolase [Hyphomicrobiales bacterium]